MKIPLLSEAPEFKPRKRLGADPALNAQLSEILDVIDILEQKVDFSISTGIKAHNAAIICLVLLVVTQGPAVLGAITAWLGVFTAQA